MSSLRVYICFSQSSSVIDFNGARPVYPKLNSELGICIRYRLIHQFKSLIVHKKHRQYHSTTRLIGTSLADYDGFLYHFTSDTPSAEICMPYTSLISLISRILFSAVTTDELRTSKLKALFFFFSSSILLIPLIYFFILLLQFCSNLYLWRVYSTLCLTLQSQTVLSYAVKLSTLCMSCFISLFGGPFMKSAARRKEIICILGSIHLEFLNFRD